MRIDEAGPRSWLLGAVAAWSVVLWLLALAGMGGHIDTLPDDPSLLQPLPTPAAPMAERLGPQAQYAAIAARPLLSPDRRPQPFSLRPESEGDDAQAQFEYVLTGVLLTPELQMAILQPAGGGDSVRVRVGQAPEDAPSWRLVALSPRGAVFEGPGGEQALDLRSYDGGADLRSAMPSPPPGGPVPVRAEDDPMMDDSPQPADLEDADGGVAAPEAQMEAIRKRIEARREQLRREARDNTPPTQQR